MTRIDVRTIALIASLTALAACDGSTPSGGNVTMRDMEVVDGTANDAMVDLDNAALEGTALENAAAAMAVNGSAVANASAPAPKGIPAEQNAANARSDGAE